MCVIGDSATKATDRESLKDIRSQQSSDGGIGVQKLAHKDSNLNFQSQNLACYHYTMGE